MNNILDESGKISLELIRKKINRRAFDYTKSEFAALTDVYRQIVHHATGKTKILSESCSACIPSAVNIVKNYIDNYETKELVIKKADNWESRSLSELREAFPTIKSTSQTGFINKLKDAGLI